jgi:hypothetical protein
MYALRGLGGILQREIYINSCYNYRVHCYTILWVLDFTGVLMLTIRQCCDCKRYADDEGRWIYFLPPNPLLEITHGYCPRCEHRALQMVRERREYRTELSVGT